MNWKTKLLWRKVGLIGEQLELNKQRKKMTSRHTNLQATHPSRKPKPASPCGSLSVGLGHEHTTLSAVVFQPDTSKINFFPENCCPEVC